MVLLFALGIFMLLLLVPILMLPTARSGPMKPPVTRIKYNIMKYLTFRPARWDSKPRQTADIMKAPGLRPASIHRAAGGLAA